MASLSLVVLIRKLRPYCSVFGFACWISYRISRAAVGSSTVDKSLLDVLLDLQEYVKLQLQLQVLQWQEKSAAIPLLSNTINLSFFLLEDVFAMFILMGCLRTIYVMYHYSWSEFKAPWEDAIFEWAKRNISIVSKELQKETDKLIPEAQQSYGRLEFMNAPEGQQLVLPKKGRNQVDLLKELTTYSSKENQTWKSGKISGTVYTRDEDHIRFMNEVYGLYSVANTLHPGVWPKLTQCEAELIAMTSNLFHGTGVGCATSGGTESLMLAIKAHWNHYGKARGIRHPEIVCGTSVHAAIDKACELFGIRKVVIDCSNPSNSYTLCPKKVRQYVTSNTIMIVASAPNYPQGTIDPIKDLGKVAQEFDIGLHVDSCLGGFVLGFAPERFPVFDFRVPGVTSLSADTHKFGYAPKGTSILLYRDRELRHAQYFSYPKWSGGIYCTPTFAGSRPSSLVGCAWAALVSIGYEGYRERSLQILNASRSITRAIREEIPELFILGQEEATMVVCFGSNEVDVYRVCDHMTAKGWQLNSLQNPASIHVCVTLALVPKADALTQDLKEAVVQVRKEDPSNSKKGTAGIYGMTGSLPEGPVNDLLKTFLDVGLTASMTNSTDGSGSKSSDS